MALACKHGSHVMSSRSRKYQSGMKGYRTLISSPRRIVKSSLVLGSGENVLLSMAMPPIPILYPVIVRISLLKQ
jgi:hypothetical protein